MPAESAQSAQILQEILAFKLERLGILSSPRCEMAAKNRVQYIKLVSKIVDSKGIRPQLDALYNDLLVDRRNVAGLSGLAPRLLVRAILMVSQ